MVDHGGVNRAAAPDTSSRVLSDGIFIFTANPAFEAVLSSSSAVHRAWNHVCSQAAARSVVKEGLTCGPRTKKNVEISEP